MWQKMKPTRLVSGLRGMAAAVLTWLYNIREGIIVIVAIAIGVILGLGLYSPSRDMAVGVAGITVYLIAILINPLQGLLMWLVTQPLFDTHLKIALGAGIPDLSLTRICVGVVIVLLVARAAVRYHQLRSFTKFDIVALLLMAGMMQSGPRGLNGLSSVQGIIDFYWIPVLTYFAVRNLVTSRRTLNVVLYAVIFIGLYSAFTAFYEVTTGDVIFSRNENARFTFYTDTNFRILRSVWNGNEAFGRVFVMSIPLAFYFYLKTSSPTRKTIWAVCLAVLFVGLFLTYKRSAWLAMVVIVFVVQFFHPQFRRLFIGLLIVVVIASALGWDNISSSSVYNDRINSDHSTVEGRTEGWDDAMEFWKARPFVGHGFRQYRSLALEKALKQNRKRFDPIESEYLEIMVSAGLAGLLPYAGLLLLMAYDGLQIYRGKVAGSLAERDLIPFFWGSLIGYAITIQTAIINNLAVPSIMFALAGAILYARSSSPTESSEMEVGAKQELPSFTVQQELAAN